MLPSTHNTICTSIEDLERVLSEVLAERVTHTGVEALTNVGKTQNLKSARSHAILTMSVDGSNGSVGKLTLVDLAGFETGHSLGAQHALI